MRHGMLFLGFLLAFGFAAASAATEPTIELASDGPLPFTLIDNRIFVPVMVNGKGPYQFIFDTGGQNILDRVVGAELGLKLEDDGDTSGAGADSEPAWRAHVDQATIGGVTMRAHDFRVISLAAVRRAIGFRRLDGVVGRELFQRFIIDIDYPNSVLRFVEPRAWQAPAALGPAIDLKFVWRIPAIPIEVGGRKGIAIIDTGDRSSLTLFGPFVKRHGLRAKYSPKVQAVTGWGIGGPIPADVTRVGTLRLGRHTVRNVVTRMPLLKTGAFARSEAAGSIGAGVLKRFRVVLDYAAGQIFLAPGAAFDERDPADRSGLWLSLGDGGFKVMSIVAGSPAAAAGVRVDDVVTAVDGVAAADIFLVELRERLKTTAPGSTVRLSLKSAAGAREVRLVLRDLI